MKPGWVVSVAVLAMSAGFATADMVVRTNGTILDGKVLSQDSREVVFQADVPAGSAAQHLDRGTVDRIIMTDSHGAVVAEADTRPVRRWQVPADPVAPPVVPPGKSPTYYVIPLHGVVGETFLASALEKSLADAAARKPTVVVLDIDSPGGLVTEAQRILKVIHHYNKELRIVALTDKDLSAAAVVTLSIREIYVKPSSTIGAATSYIPSNMQMSGKLEEKMQSAWRAVARNSAEEGGHDPLLAESMIDNDRELHVEIINGKHVVKEGPGDKMLSRKGKILTLTSHEAIDCGLAAGEAEDFAELGKNLKFNGWTECKGLGTLLADAFPKKQQAFEAEMKKIESEFKHNIDDIKASDPTAGEYSTRIVTTTPRPGFPAPPIVPTPPTIPGRPGVPSPHVPHVITPAPVQTQQVQIITTDVRARWKERSLACVVALQKAEQNIKDIMSLADAFGQGGSEEAMRDLLGVLSELRVKVYDERNKYVSKEVKPSEIATTAPAAKPAPKVAAAPTPAVPVAPTTAPAAKNSGEKLAPLNGALADQIKAAISGHTYEASPVVGGAFAKIQFEDLPASGAVLIGFRYCPGKFVNRDVVDFVQPIYLGSTGEILGQPHGKANDNVLEVKARAGYAVGGIAIRGGGGLDAFTLTFMRLKDAALDPTDSYAAAPVGGTGGREVNYLSDGTLIVGLCGKDDPDKAYTGLGVIFQKHTPASKTKPVR